MRSELQRDGPAADLDAASTRLHFTAENAHQCRFPCAILAQKRMDLPGADIEIDATQGLHATKQLSDRGQPDEITH